VASDSLFAVPPADVREEDCYFYHVMDVPGHGAVGGDFDLRGGEDEYLGNVELSGRRVLEIGPASGFLAFHMESRGASVVSVELGPDAEWDIVPQSDLDLDEIREQRQLIMRQLRNGFWWAHRHIGSRAQVYYGDVYALPDELGQFDLAVMAAVLRHTRDPLRIVEQTARLANKLVLTEMHMPELDDEPVARLVPARESRTWDTWWDFSPGFLARFLSILGFEAIAVTHHVQQFLADGRARSVPFFTVVAERGAKAALGPSTRSPSR
jgi:SAM-dependent methyltransferase